MPYKETKVTQNSKKILFVCIILAFFSCYFLDRSKELSEIMRTVDSIVALLLVILLLIHFEKNKITMSLAIGYLILFASIIPGLFLNNLFNIHWLYAIIAFEIIRTEFNPTGRGYNWVLYLTFLFIIIQMALLRSSDGRPVLSIEDANYSAYYLSIFAALLIYSNKIILSIIVIILSCFTLSRAFFLATILFISIYAIKKIFKIRLVANGWITLIVLIFIPIVFSTIYLLLVPEAIDVNTYDYQKLFSYKDQSNIDRSIANIIFINYITENPMSIMSGLNIERYTNEVFHNSPHTSAYQIIFNYGLLYLIALFLLLYSFRKRIFLSFHSRAFISALLCWMLFLGGVLYGPQTIILALIINKCNSIGEACAPIGHLGSGNKL